MLSFDLAQAKRYDVAGPRYTSYPTAVQFKELPPNALAAGLQRDRESGRDLSLYFHLPFCETLCWFCGCTVVIKKKSGAGDYLDTLARDMDNFLDDLGPDRNVRQVHFGGGTPTFLTPDEIRRLGEGIAQRFHFADPCEFSSEIDPRRLTREHLEALRAIGCNRLSMGVQDNKPEVQAAINRIQPVEITRQVIDWSRDLNFDSINIDLIYGLPGQTPESFRETLEEVSSWRPERIVTFSYAHVPWLKPAQKLVAKAGLPAPEEKLRMLKDSIEQLTAAGYFYIGMDHFALPDDPLSIAQKEKTLQRNFQGYTTCGGTSLYGFGISSISQLDDIYFQKERKLDDWSREVNAGETAVMRGVLLNRDDMIRREVIQRIMCHLELDFEDIENEFSIDFRKMFADELAELEPLAEDKLLEISSESLHVTETGRLFVRNIAMKFDAYLEQTPNRFSKTV